MKRILAFTLIELIVAMLLSSIIVTLAYSVYSRTENSFRKAFHQFGQTNELLQLQALLNTDCNNAMQVSFEDEIMTVKRIDQRMICYLLSTGMIIREDGILADTFHLETYRTSVQYLLNKPPLAEKLMIEIQLENTMTYLLTARVYYSNRIKFEYNRSNNPNI